MSVKAKKRFKNLSRAIGIALFALLMFTNIKIATMNSSELAKGDISLFGIEVNLFDATDAYNWGGGGGSGGSSSYCDITRNCYSWPNSFDISCSAFSDPGAHTAECNGFDNSYVECRGWYANGSLKSYSYQPCP